MENLFSQELCYSLSKLTMLLVLYTADIPRIVGNIEDSRRIIKILKSKSELLTVEEWFRGGRAAPRLRNTLNS